MKDQLLVIDPEVQGQLGGYNFDGARFRSYLSERGLPLREIDKVQLHLHLPQVSKETKEGPWYYHDRALHELADPNDPDSKHVISYSVDPAELRKPSQQGDKLRTETEYIIQRYHRPYNNVRNIFRGGYAVLGCLAGEFALGFGLPLPGGEGVRTAVEMGLPIASLLAAGGLYFGPMLREQRIAECAALLQRSALPDGVLSLDFKSVL